MGNGWDTLLEEQEKNEQRSQSKSTGGASTLFMKIRAGEKHRVRFVGEPQFVWIHWDERDLSAKKKIIISDEYVDKFKSRGLTVRRQVVSNVIDRKDEKLRFKILEKGMNVFGPVLARYATVTGPDGKRIHPGGPQGDDWSIESNKPADIRQTKYTVVNLQPTPFSTEEKELISRSKKGKDGKRVVKEEFKDFPLGEKGLIDLEEIYNSEKYVQQIEELLKDVGSDVDSAESIEVEELEEAEDVEEEVAVESSSGDVSDDDLNDLLF